MYNSWVSYSYDLVCRIVLLCLIPRPCGRGEEWPGNETMIGNRQLQYTVIHSQYVPVVYVCVLMAAVLPSQDALKYTTQLGMPTQVLQVCSLLYTLGYCTLSRQLYCDGVMVVCVTAVYCLVVPPQDALKAVEKIPVVTNNAIHLSLLENYKVSHSTVGLFLFHTISDPFPFQNTTLIYHLST